MNTRQTDLEKLTAQMDLAGFTDAHQRLGRMVPFGEMFVPEKVWLAGDNLHWKQGKARALAASRVMLNRFLKLDDAESVLRFAKTWGVLRMSKRGNVWRPGTAPLSQGAEPISGWLYYSRRARAVLGVAAALRQNKLGDLADWNQFSRTISRDGLKEPDRKWLNETVLERPTFGMWVTLLAEKPTLRSAREFLASEISRWLDCWKTPEQTGGLSDFGLRWSETQKRWELQIDYHGLLFAAIALQLVLVFADADALYSCSGCGYPYFRARDRKRPKPGCANYCDECKGPRAQQRAVESYRQRKAEAVQLHKDGLSAPKIAEALGVDDVARVRRWIVPQRA